MLKTKTMDLRDYIWERDRGLCVYCNTLGQHIDHVLPVKHGGKTRRNNLVLACAPCNHDKGCKLDIVYITKGFHHLLRVGESLAWVQESGDERCSRLISTIDLPIESHVPEPSIRIYRIRKYNFPGFFTVTVDSDGFILCDCLEFPRNWTCLHTESVARTESRWVNRP